MNVKLRITEVVQLIDKRLNIDQVSRQLQPIASQTGIMLAEPQAGAGYYQWSLPGDGWTAFPLGSDSEKSAVAIILKERKAAFASALKGSPLTDAVFTMPSADFVYFRPSGTSYEVALTAWGMKYPDRPATRELDTYISKSSLQTVNIGFEWAGTLLPHFSFHLSGYGRTTSDDGLFHVDGPLPVGKSYEIDALDGRTFTLTVEKGRGEYVYDLTRYFTATVMVTHDGMPKSDTECTVAFNGTSQTIRTDASGRASVSIPLVADALGQTTASQPECLVTCGNDSQQQTPSGADATLSYVFSSETPKAATKQEPVKEPVKEPEPEPDPEPEFVFVQLKDYGGEPLPDMPFTLTTDKQGRQQLQTDADGLCKVPKEWFTNKKKFKIDFQVTADYQLSHDLHDPYDKKKRK